MDYFSLTTAGNAIDFGNLTQGTQRAAGLANSIRGVVGGGEDSANPSDVFSTSQLPPLGTPLILAIFH
jgi:hypothetical protein